MSTKESIVSPQLYAAATESLVSDASASSTFEKMISVAFTHSSLETFFKELRETESLIRKEFEVSSMPSPWRSSKSVISTSMKLNIPLIDDNGVFVGKSFLQNKIKELKTVKKEITVEEYSNKIINYLSNIPSELDSKEIFKRVSEYIGSNY